jgi:hypothetical protein
MPFVHFDEARRSAINNLRLWTSAQPNIIQSLLIVDLYGKIRVVLWEGNTSDTSTLVTVMKTECGPWWTNDIFKDKELAKGALKVFENAWIEAKQDAVEQKLESLIATEVERLGFPNQSKRFGRLKKNHPQY